MPRSRSAKSTPRKLPQVIEVTPDITPTAEVEPPAQQTQDHADPLEDFPPGQPSTSSAPAPTPTPRKQYRVSHRDITDYPFTADQLQTLVDFIWDHPCLYDKSDRGYANPRVKQDLWRQCAELFPNDTYL